MRRSALPAVDHNPRASRLARVWPIFELLALAAVAPLLLFPGGWRTLALGALPLLWIGRRIATGHFVRRTPYHLAVLVLLIMTLVSLWATYDLSVSLPKLAGLLLGVSMLYAVAGFATDGRRYRLAVAGLLLVTAAFVALALVGTGWGQKLPGLQALGAALPVLVRGLPGAQDTFGAPEVAGTLLWPLFVPAAVALAAWQGRHARRGVLAVALGALSLTMLAMLVLAQSRSAWFGAAVGGSLFVAGLGRRGRWLAGLGLAVSVGLLVLLFLPGNLPDEPPPALGTVTTLSFSDREAIWLRALWGLRDFGYSGMGLGTFRHLVTVLYPLPSVPPSVDIAHAHNELLQAGLDLGVPGMLAFAALHVIAVGQAYRSIRAGTTPFTRLTTLALLAGLTAHATFGLTDAIALGAKPGVLFWAALGLTAADARMPDWGDSES